LYFCSLLSLTFVILCFLSLRKSHSLLVKIFFFFKCFVFISLALVLFSAALNLRKYEVFSLERLIAEVRCRKIGNDEMELIFKPQDKRGKENKFILRGEQWMIGGEILRWEKPLYFLGMNSLYKLSRLSSRYLKIEQERLATHFELNGGTDKFWIFLYRHQRPFPFIEAVYGNAAYSFPKDNIRFQLYVNQSGYVIKEQPLR